MSGRYFHRDGRPAASFDEVADEWDDDKKRVELTQVGVSEVSTVFLGINHRFGDGPPLIFESMVFGGPLDQEQRRYSTEVEARVGHAELVAAASQDVPADVVALRALLAEHEFENAWKQARALYDAGVRIPREEDVHE